MGARKVITNESIWSTGREVLQSYLIVAGMFVLCACHARQGQFYQVQRGDTATRIAHLHDIVVGDIQKANPQKNLNRIIAGQRLWIPSMKKVSRGNAQLQAMIHTQKPQRVSSKTKPTVASKAKPSAKVKNNLNFHWPYRGKVISGFGKRNLKMHNGIDIELPSGQAIAASQTGKVAYVGEGIEGYGKAIIVQHPGTLFTIYAFLGSLSARKGQLVKQGQTIALAQKQSGRSFFHFEIRKVKTALDPQKFLR